MSQQAFGARSRVSHGQMTYFATAFSDIAANCFEGGLARQWGQDGADTDGHVAVVREKGPACVPRVAVEHNGGAHGGEGKFRENMLREGWDVRDGRCKDGPGSV